MIALRQILQPMGTMYAMEFLTDKLRRKKKNIEFFDMMDH